MDEAESELQGSSGPQTPRSWPKAMLLPNHLRLAQQAVAPGPRGTASAGLGGFPRPPISDESDVSDIFSNESTGCQIEMRLPGIRSRTSRRGPLNGWSCGGGSGRDPTCRSCVDWRLAPRGRQRALPHASGPTIPRPWAGGPACRPETQEP